MTRLATGILGTLNSYPLHLETISLCLHRINIPHSQGLAVGLFERKIFCEVRDVVVHFHIYTKRDYVGCRKSAIFQQWILAGKS